MNGKDLSFLHALLYGGQCKRPVFPPKEAAERAFVITPWEQIIGLLQRPAPGAYKQDTMSGPRRSGRRYF